MKVVTIVGARPQFIKAAVLSRLFRQSSGVSERLVHSGQHYDRAMSDVFFEDLELPRPDRKLPTPAGGQAEQTAAMLIGIDRVLVEERPDAVLLYGDTNTTLAGVLAASKLGVPVAHVEAGLRSYDRSMPEEVNRVVTDHLSRWLFCPTEAAVANLVREGVTTAVHQVGDVMCNALLYYGEQPYPSPALRNLGLEDRPFILGTIHRAGNTDSVDRFGAIWDGLGRLARELPVVLPLHPRSRKVLEASGLAVLPGLHVIEPVGYRHMLTLERRARLIVTDSGGVQKEAYMLGIPCLTLRENTEWVETVEAGWNLLVGTDGARLIDGACHFLEAGPPTNRPPYYGDGCTGQRMLEILGRA